MKKGLTVIFSSHRSSDFNKEFENIIKTTSGVPDTQVICIENHNQYSLTHAYNMGLDIYDSFNREDIVVFCHNDIHFKTPKWGLILIRKFLSNLAYGIIGLAGSIELAGNGVWWNNMAKCFGIVDHTDGVREWTTTFAPPINNIQPVVVIDGVFMAIDPNKIMHDFNEEYKGFHLYDVSFSFDNFLAGVKIGVITDIRIMHESPGVTNDEWEKNRQQFANENKQLLPIKI